MIVAQNKTVIRPIKYLKIFGPKILQENHKDQNEKNEVVDNHSFPSTHKTKKRFNLQCPKTQIKQISN